MPVTCTAAALVAAAAPFDGLSEREHMVVQTYELAVIAGVSLDPNVLLANARAFQKCSAEDLAVIRPYLECTIANL